MERNVISRSKRTQIILLTSIILVIELLRFAAFSEPSDATALDELKRRIGADHLSIRLIDSEQRILEYQYQDAKRGLSSLPLQAVYQQEKIDRLNYELSLHGKKRIQRQIIEEHELQRSYYQVCLLMQELDIARRERELLLKKQEIAGLQMKQGSLLRVDYDELVNDIQAADNRMLGIRAAVDNEILSMRFHLGLSEDDEFTPSFVISEASISGFNFNLDDLISKCHSNHIDLLKLVSNLEFNDRLMNKLEELYGKESHVYQMADAERQSLMIRLSLNQSQIKLKIQKMVAQTRRQKQDYDVIVQRRSILFRKMELLTKQLDEGQISEIKYWEGILQIEKERLRLNQSVVELLNNIDALRLVEFGVL